MNWHVKGLLSAGCLAVGLGAATVLGQSVADTAQAHRAAAKAAAGQDHLGLLDRVCTAPAPQSGQPAAASPQRGQAAATPAPAERQTPPRSEWHAEPVKVFDNLFTITPDKPRTFWFDTYIKSAERFRDVVAKAGADVIIANHTNFDGTKVKAPALAKRRPGDPHPYVVGADAVSGT